jgi:hypothetical protein
MKRICKNCAHAVRPRTSAGRLAGWLACHEIARSDDFDAPFINEVNRAVDDDWGCADWQARRGKLPELPWPAKEYLGKGRKMLGMVRTLCEIAGCRRVATLMCERGRVPWWEDFPRFTCDEHSEGQAWDTEPITDFYRWTKINPLGMFATCQCHGGISDE